MFNDLDVIDIFENELPGFIFYLFESPLWTLCERKTLGYVKNMYTLVLPEKSDEIKKVIDMIEALL